jgi:hypothetical protein
MFWNYSADLFSRAQFCTHGNLCAPLQTIRVSGSTNGFGIAFWFLRDPFDLPSLDATRTELFLEDAFRGRNICSLFDLVESVGRELFHFEQFFPMSEVTMAVPVIHNAVCEVFGNSGKLGQLFDLCGVDINGGDHIVI